MLEVFSGFLSVIFKIWFLLRCSLFCCFSAIWLWSAFLLFLLYSFLLRRLRFLVLYSSYQTWKIFTHYCFILKNLSPSLISGILVLCILDCLILLQRFLKSFRHLHCFQHVIFSLNQTFYFPYLLITSQKKWVMALDDKKASVLLILMPSVQLTTWYIFNQEPRLLCVAFEPIN